MSTPKRFLLASAIAAAAFVSLQSFTSERAFKCVGVAGVCRLYLPDGTVIEGPGTIVEVFPSGPAPAQGANLAVAGL